MLEWEKRLVPHGFEITSRWIRGNHEMDISVHENELERKKENRRFANEDVEDIDSADVVVVFSPRENFGQGRGGRHWETGYAWGSKRWVVLVGEQENVFHHLERVIVTSEENLLSILEVIRGCILTMRSDKAAKW
jgi:nucleoside 2-deoxyribosyltransferase